MIYYIETRIWFCLSCVYYVRILKKILHLQIPQKRLKHMNSVCGIWVAEDFLFPVYIGWLEEFETIRKTRDAAKGFPNFRELLRGDLETEEIFNSTVQKTLFFIELRFKFFFCHFAPCSAGELSHNIPSALSLVLYCATAG